MMNNRWMCVNGKIMLVVKLGTNAIKRRSGINFDAVAHTRHIHLFIIGNAMSVAHVFMTFRNFLGEKN